MKEMKIEFTKNTSETVILDTPVGRITIGNTVFPNGSPTITTVMIVPNDNVVSDRVINFKGESYFFSKVND